MYEDPKSKISQLQKILDAREDLISKKVRRHDLHDRENTVSQDWDQSEFRVGEEVFQTPVKKTVSSFSKKILIGSIIFFIVAILFVLFKFLIGGNLVSGNNIAITVKAPISVSGGEVIPFEIEIKNDNNVSLLGADLGITFPAGANDADNTAVPAKRVQDFLGDILPGQAVKKNYRIALFGQENEKKEISLNLSYKVSGSNSLFNKTKNFSVLVGSAPISLVISGPTEVNTNQLVNYTIEVTSNSPSVVKNILLKAEYPFGFTFMAANPQNFFKNNLWFLGDLAPGEKRIIRFSGILIGQEGEERGFNFNIGSQSKVDNLSIDVPFTSSFSSITIRRPFVSADVSLNGSNNSEYVSTAGSRVEAAVNWRNNLAYEVSDISFEIKLNGNALNKASIQADGGYYRSIDNTIIFNKTTDSDLAILQPGQEGISKFSFSSFGVNTVTGAGLTNPTIVLDISVKGRRLDYLGDQVDVLFSDSRRIKLTSDPQLFAKALYYIGPFKNVGSIPPKAEQETTYTVTWTVTNPLNNLSGAKVVAVLPPYVKWLDQISPSREKVDYDPSTGQVSWSVGNISAGAGSILPAKEVSFQISFLPSVDQIGNVPNLIGDAVLTAKDNFTLTNVSDSFSFLNTRLVNDPYFKIEAETVIK